ncbi:AraC family transcriptional regulator [soil metagenome]
MATTTLDVSAGKRNRHVFVSAASGLVDCLEAKGVSPESVLNEAGLRLEQLCDPSASVTLASYCALMECAAKETQDRGFGLAFGHGFQPERLGLIGRLALASPTLGSALHNVARFFPYHQQLTATSFKQLGATHRLECRVLDGSVTERRQAAEMTMAVFRNILRRCLGSAWCPQHVLLEHPRIGLHGAHERAFGSFVHFGQPTNALVWEGSDLHRPMPQANAVQMVELREELVRLGGSVGSLSLVDRIRGEIRSTLSSGNADIASVAAVMGIARWTLQRRLATHGYTFQELVNEVRRNVALQYLRERFLPIADVATLLGYSETSAFTRSCTRWFGEAPTTMRQGGMFDERPAS